MAPLVDPEGREVKALHSLVSFRDKAVIDIGCGDGRTVRHIAQTAASVLGADPDQRAIARARSAAGDASPGRCTFMVADCATLDLAPAAFDIVVFSRSL